MLTYSVYIVLLLLLLPSRRDKTSNLRNEVHHPMELIIIPVGTHIWSVAMAKTNGKNQLVLLHFLGGNFRVYLELSRVKRQENIMHITAMNPTMTAGSHLGS